MKRVLLLFLGVVFTLTGYTQALQVFNTPTNYKKPFWLAENILVDSNFVVLPPFGPNGLPLVQPASTQLGIFRSNGSTFPVDSGIVMCGWSANDVLPGTNGTSPNTGPFTDPELAAVLASIKPATAPVQGIYDRAQIVFSFIATSDSIKFNFVFGSHEYANYTCSNYNDVFGFFLTGPGINGNSATTTANLAVIPNTTTPVAVNSINSGSGGNPSLCLAANPNYVAHSVMWNGPNSTITSLSGFTDKFTAKAQVTCGNFYTIRLVISNVADHILSSAVFLEANSFKSPSIIISQNLNSGNSFQDSLVVEGCKPSYMVFEKDGNKNVGMGINFAFSGNAINGVDVVQIPDSIWIPPGSLKDSILIQAYDDGIVEPDDTLIITMQPVQTSCFTYPPERAYFHLRDRKVLVAEANVAGTDTIDCPGDSATLVGSITGEEGISSGWWSDDTTAGYQRVIYPHQTTTYYFNAIDECSSDTITDSITVYLANYEPLTYNVDTVQVCRGDTAYFLADIQNGRAPYYITWPDGSNNLYYSDVPTADTTFYPFRIVDACGVTVKDSMMAHIAPDPVAAFSYLNDYLIPLRVQFTNRSSNAANLLWDFGDGNTSTLADPVWDYDSPGTYQVTLSITSNEGCTDVVVLDVTVETDFYLYIPTAFTPDGDGINECFVIQGVGFESFEIKIFDRWGNQVFYTDNIDECWDGTINGSLAPQGAYTYTVFLRLPFDKIHQRNGVVTVYR